MKQFIEILVVSLGVFLIIALFVSALVVVCFWLANSVQELLLNLTGMFTSTKALVILLFIVIALICTVIAVYELLNERWMR